MATIVKEVTLKKGFGPPIINHDIESHDDDPVVIKKVEKAKATLKRVGLPDLKKK